MIDISASDPSPIEPRTPTNLASVSLLSCLDVVPDPTSPWNPEMAPQAIVTNSSGTIDGVPAGTSVLKAGATIVGDASTTDPNSRPSPMNSWMPLM